MPSPNSEVARADERQPGRGGHKRAGDHRGKGDASAKKHRADTPAHNKASHGSSISSKHDHRQFPASHRGGGLPRAARSSAPRHPSVSSSSSAVVSAATAPSSAPSSSRLSHPFRANFNDHFETSVAALQDVLPVVQELRQLLRPSTPERFTLYDPYYCSGSVVEAWRSLGVTHVLHENRDFYADVAKGTVPGPFDALITNPPFSDDHIWRLLDFLVTQSPLRPWAFVAPDYIAAKPQYKAWVTKHFTPTATLPSPGAAGAVKGAARRPPPPIPSIESILPPFLLPPEEGDGAAETTKEKATGDEAPPSSSSAASPAKSAAVVGPEPFYLVPRVRYDYAHPLGVGHDHSHFKSMWYVWAGRHTSEVLRGVTVALSGRGRQVVPPRATAAASASSSASSSPSSLMASGKSGAPVTVVNGYRALVEGHHVTATDRRPNPERRQRAAASGGGRGGGKHGWR